jgi:topoisomerase IA-like protein
VNERRRVARIGLARANFLGREDVEEQRQVGRVGVRADAEVLGRTHREAQLRVKVRLGRNGERVRFTRVRASIRREQCGDLVADPGRVGIGHEEPDVVAKVGEGRLLLQLE